MADTRLLWLAAALAAASAVFLFWDLPSRWGFVLELRATKLAALVVTGTAVAVATILFQTVASNRILTPSIMGFDALFLLMQTGLVWALGIQGFARLGTVPKFGAELIVMMAAALMLFGTILGRGRQDIHRMILTGVILGVLFRSLSGFLQRVLDPNAFAVVQSVSFATFGNVDGDLLWLAAVLVIAAVLLLGRLAPSLDVMALGRTRAVSLGLSYERLTLLVLALVAMLVSVSTALVGPVTFLGLIVASLAHSAVGSARHDRLLAAAALIGALLLVAGQTVFERVLGLQSTLSVIIEFGGGMLFLWLLLKGRVR